MVIFNIPYWDDWYCEVLFQEVSLSIVGLGLVTARKLAICIPGRSQVCDLFLRTIFSDEKTIQNVTSEPVQLSAGSFGSFWYARPPYLFHRFSEGYIDGVVSSYTTAYPLFLLVILVLLYIMKVVICINHPNRSNMIIW